MFSSSQSSIAALTTAVQSMPGVSSANHKMACPAFWQHDSPIHKVLAEIQKRDATNEMAGWITMLDLKNQTKLSHEEVVKGLRQLIHHKTIEFMVGNGQSNHRYRLVKDASTDYLKQPIDAFDDITPFNVGPVVEKPKYRVQAQKDDILLSDFHSDAPKSKAKTVKPALDGKAATEADMVTTGDFTRDTNAAAPTFSPVAFEIAAMPMAQIPVPHMRGSTQSLPDFADARLEDANTGKPFVAEKSSVGGVVVDASDIAADAEIVQAHPEPKLKLSRVEIFQQKLAKLSAELIEERDSAMATRVERVANLAAGQALDELSIASSGKSINKPRPPKMKVSAASSKAKKRKPTVQPNLTPQRVENCVLDVKTSAATMMVTVTFKQRPENASVSIPLEVAILLGQKAAKQLAKQQGFGAMQA